MDTAAVPSLHRKGRLRRARAPATRTLKRQDKALGLCQDMGAQVAETWNRWRRSTPALLRPMMEHLRSWEYNAEQQDASEYIGIITNTDFGQVPKWTEKPGEASCSSGAYWTRSSSWTLPLWAMRLLFASILARGSLCAVQYLFDDVLPSKVLSTPLYSCAAVAWGLGPNCSLCQSASHKWRLTTASGQSHF